MFTKVSSFSMINSKKRISKAFIDRIIVSFFARKSHKSIVRKSITSCKHKFNINYFYHITVDVIYRKNRTEKELDSGVENYSLLII
jgi:hypothetical protein